MPSPCGAGPDRATPESTAQDCAMESMRHSSLPHEPERRAVVEVARRYQSPSQASRSNAARQRRAGLASVRREPGLGVRPRGSTMRERTDEQPASQTLSPSPSFADAAHAVVPVARPHQGSPCSPVSAMPWSIAAGAMLEKGRRLLRDHCGGRRHSCSPGRSTGPSRKGTISSSTAASPVAVDIVRRREGEPYAVVGDPRANALSGMGQPPMLHVALDELSRSARSRCARASAGRGEREGHAS